MEGPWTLVCICTLYHELEGDGGERSPVGHIISSITTFRARLEKKGARARLVDVYEQQHVQRSQAVLEGSNTASTCHYSQVRSVFHQVIHMFNLNITVSTVSRIQNIARLRPSPPLRHALAVAAAEYQILVSLSRKQFNFLWYHLLPCFR